MVKWLVPGAVVSVALLVSVLALMLPTSGNVVTAQAEPDLVVQSIKMIRGSVGGPMRSECTISLAVEVKNNGGNSGPYDITVTNSLGDPPSIQTVFKHLAGQTITKQAFRHTYQRGDDGVFPFVKYIVTTPSLFVIPNNAKFACNSATQNP